MKLYRIMEHAPIKNYTYPFYIEEQERGFFSRKWVRVPNASFLTSEEAFRYIERSYTEDKVREEQRRALPREVVRGYVASDGVFHPLASE